MFLHAFPRGFPTLSFSLSASLSPSPLTRPTSRHRRPTFSFSHRHGDRRDVSAGLRRFVGYKLITPPSAISITLKTIKVRINQRGPPGADIKCFLKDRRSINSQMEQDIFFGFLTRGGGGERGIGGLLFREAGEQDDLRRAQVVERCGVWVLL